MQWITALVPSVTVLTALAAWYGYELTRARGRYFGIDPTVLEFGTQQYVFRTASAVLAPLLYLVVAAIALLWLHAVVRWAKGHPNWTVWVRAAAALMTGVGLILTIEGLRVLGDRTVLSGMPVLRPLVLAAGAVLVTYGPWLLRQTMEGPAQEPQLWQRGIYVLVVAIALLSLFWSVSVSAARTGLEDSYQLARNRLHDLPRVIVYSSTALSLEGPGVETSPVTQPGSAYRWRYSGLRLLVRSGGKYFLLPTGWFSRNDVAIVLQDGPQLRFEFQEPENLQS